MFKGTYTLKEQRCKNMETFRLKLEIYYEIINLRQGAFKNKTKIPLC